MEVQDRLRVTWSWQVAAELARRNPNLVVLEHRPADTSDSLGLWDQHDTAATALIDLDRAGALHVFAPGAPHRHHVG